MRQQVAECLEVNADAFANLGSVGFESVVLWKLAELTTESARPPLQQSHHSLYTTRPTRTSKESSTTPTLHTLHPLDSGHTRACSESDT